jgi:hypothetical protein
MELTFPAPVLLMSLLIISCWYSKSLTIKHITSTWKALLMRCIAVHANSVYGIDFTAVKDNWMLGEGLNCR